MIKLGALWRKTDKTGGVYLSGTINETTRVIVLPAKEKKSDRSPDYYLFLDENKPMDNKQSPTRAADIIADVKKVMSQSGGTVQPEPKPAQQQLKQAPGPMFNDLDPEGLPF